MPKPLADQILETYAPEPEYGRAYAFDPPVDLATMVDGAIRMVSPVMYMRRTATQDAEIRGQKIAEGEKVMMYCGAANRDPSVFADPDRFNPARPNGKDHVAFGIGPHVCFRKLGVEFTPEKRRAA